MAKLARATGNTDAVTIHLDDQMDAKSLLGTYVATAIPGEFAWQPGPLTQVLCCRSGPFHVKTAFKKGFQPEFNSYNQTSKLDMDVNVQEYVSA